MTMSMMTARVRRKIGKLTASPVWKTSLMLSSAKRQFAKTLSILPVKFACSSTPRLLTRHASIKIALVTAKEVVQRTQRTLIPDRLKREESVGGKWVLGQPQRLTCPHPETTRLISRPLLSWLGPTTQLPSREDLRPAHHSRFWLLDSRSPDPPYHSPKCLPQVSRLTQDHHQ